MPNTASRIDYVDQTINCTVQAQAVLSTLLNIGQCRDKGFGELTHATVIDCLWAVKTLIGQAQEAAEKIMQATE
ncbi:MAG TPA: hypothetical protein VJ654_20405 [Noviherbaspirillum sp.]|nr:hypothetical protein [Noviherbaspirillum sp.]